MKAVAPALDVFSQQQLYSGKLNKLKNATLSVSQAKTFDAVIAAAKSHSIIHIWTREGLGCSTILTHLAEALNAKLIGLPEFVDAQQGKHPYTLEDNFYALLESALEPGRTLIVDDFHAVKRVGENCYHNPRTKYYDAIANAMVKLVNDKGCQLIVGSNGRLPKPMARVAYVHGVAQLLPADYQHIVGSKGFSNDFDVDEVYRFAPRLNFYQLAQAAEHCTEKCSTSTEEFIEYLRSQQLTSNVELNEVDQVELKDLVGVQDLVESLESNVVFPLENDRLAQKYNLRPSEVCYCLDRREPGKRRLEKLWLTVFVESFS